MSLQVRLRHALGDRLIELPLRAVDDPLVVGRASGAAVQVPSVTVAPRHCVFFAHEGHWVVEDAGTSVGTYVNGEPVQGPTFLQIGDVISLGADAAAPTIEVDPEGPAEGRTGYALADAAGALGAPAGTAPHSPAGLAGGYAPAPAPAPTYPGAYAAPAAPPYAPAPYAPPAYAAAPASAAPVGGWSQQADSPSDDDPTWNLGAADPTTGSSPRRYALRGKPRTSDSAMMFGILVGVAIIGGMALLVYNYNRREPVKVVQQKPQIERVKPAKVEKDPPKVSSIFDGGREVAPKVGKVSAKGAEIGAGVGPGLSARAGASGDGPDDAETDDPATATGGNSAPPGASAEGSDPVDSPAPADPAKDDPAWKQVENAHYSTDEAKAILIFDDYARTLPGSNAETVKQYTDDALDRIWFERVEGLFKQRDDITRKIKDTETAMVEETDEAYKKRVLIPLKQQLVRQSQAKEAELSELKYTENKPPRMTDDDDLDRLRKARDKTVYSAWKSRVLSHIRRTHGELPWAAEKI